jgi:hypothetical protein
MPGHCASAPTVAPAWRWRFAGTTEQGAPADVAIPVDLPPTTLRTILQ